MWMFVLTNICLLNVARFSVPFFASFFAQCVNLRFSVTFFYGPYSAFTASTAPIVRMCEENHIFAQFILCLHTNEVVKLCGSRILGLSFSVSLVPFIHFPFTFLFFIAVQHHLSCSVRMTWPRTKQHLYTYQVKLTTAYLSILYEIFSALWTAVFYISYFVLLHWSELDEWKEYSTYHPVYSMAYWLKIISVLFNIL